MTLDEVLFALLFRRSFRRAFSSGERPALDLDPADEASLASLDCVELEQSARLACHAVLERSQRGVGSLLDAFPRTIEAWHTAHPGADLDDLAAAFAESAPFAEWQPAGAGDGLGPPLEEAFRSFCEPLLGPELAPTVRTECAVALLRALIVNPEPAFAIPSFIRRAPKGFYAVIERADAPFLAAALEQRLVMGPITPSLAAILRAEEPRLLGAGPRDTEASTAALRALGLIA